MRKLFLVSCCLLVLVAMAACGQAQQSTVSGQGCVFEAVVTEVDEDSILIMPVAGSNEANAALNVGLRVIRSEHLPDLKVGDRVRIDYDGIMTRSIPAQLGQIYSFEVIH